MIAPAAHLDADTIAAFAENALPPASRIAHMKHLAGCDRCRRILANVALINTEAVAVAATPVVAPLVEKAAPWWSGIFGRGGLAVALGAVLILLIGGIAALIVQRGQDANTTSVARVEDFESGRAAAPAANANAALAEPNANSFANSAVSPADTSAANVIAAANLPVDRPAATPNVRLDSATAAVPPVADTGTDAQRFTESQPKAADAPPPPPPPPSGSTVDVTGSQPRKQDEREAKAKAEDDEVPAMKRRSAELSVRDSPAPAAKSGPARSGPLQPQNAQTNKLGEMSVTRRVSGRNFAYRDSVWYDSAYTSQATLNFRRGTEEFNSLDSGLRSIANTLGGTVVVVWKGKAYRIQ